jgi:hypothetical protein
MFSNTYMDIIEKTFPAFLRSPNDIRALMIERVFIEIEKTNSRHRLAKAGTPQLVADLIDMIRRCRFTGQEFEEFKKCMLEDAEPAFHQYAGILQDTLGTLETDIPIQILSIGCGRSGHIEHLLDAGISSARKDRTNLVDIRWCGMDILEPDEDSFFRTRNNRFIKIDDGSETPYLKTAQSQSTAQKAALTILIAHFSYHHMDIAFSDFLDRCGGAERIFLLEELIRRVDWRSGDYRIARITCDLLSNMGFDPEWAEAFMRDPSLFKVRYLPREIIHEHGGTIIDIPGCSPDLSVVMIESPQ